MAKRNTSRQRILGAAAELALEEGSAHVSLDAIAARAGVSKGGLLYNFPSKSHLLEALVQQYVDAFAAALDEEADAEERPLLERYLSLSVAELEKQPAAPSGLLAALAENPALMAPVRRFNRTLLDRMKSEAKDDATVLLLFLVMEGLHASKALGTDVLSQGDRDLVLAKLQSMLGSLGG